MKKEKKGARTCRGPAACEGAPYLRRPSKKQLLIQDYYYSAFWTLPHTPMSTIKPIDRILEPFKATF